MTEKRLYRIYNKETDKTMSWCFDNEELFYMTEWYGDIDYGVEEYKMVSKW